MKAHLIILILFLCTSGKTFSQRAQSVYLELGTPSVVAVNYDTRFFQKQTGLGGRIGIGGFSLRGNNIDGDKDYISALFIPVGITYLFESKTKCYLELGAGITPVFASSETAVSDNGNMSSTFGHAYVGFRIQPKEKGFLFRAGLSPVFGKFGFLPQGIGISFGYKF